MPTACWPEPQKRLIVRPGVAYGQPALSTARRAMSAPWSPMPLALPAMTSSISVELTPVRCTIAFRHWASSSCGWMWCRAPFCLPLPRGVRTPSMIQASRSAHGWHSPSRRSRGGIQVAHHVRPARRRIEQVLTGVASPAMADRVVLVRHGETEWSSTRRHTGRTDIPLNEEGRRLAAAPAAGARRHHRHRRRPRPDEPAARARDTCALAGLGERAEIEPDLVEWDYGAAEGRRTDEIRREVPGWTVWTHDPEGGETLDEVGGARRPGARPDPRHDRASSSLFAHAHILRILTARWCGLDPRAGRMFMLDPASVSILGHERETRVHRALEPRDDRRPRTLHRHRRGEPLPSIR